MHATLYNQARILYRLEPVTGLLIKSGKDSSDPTRPEMEFIRTWADVAGAPAEVPFLPGSSVKGVIRSHAERILRTLQLNVCDVTSEKGGCIQKGAKTPSYREHCLACRTFGQTTLASRLRFGDAFPWKPEDDAAQRMEQFERIHIAQRPGIRIDRRLGTAARGALYEIETVATGGFFGEITLRNYQLWQLGLLALVLRDINEGHQRVGAMKSRGLGRVKVVVQEFRLDQYGALLELEDIRIRGVGMNRSLLDPYDLYPDDVIDRPKSLRSQVEESIRQSFIPDNGDSDSAWRELAAGIIASPHWKHLLTSKQKGI